ncbi:MAG TPA: ribosome maturation factor RimM [Candidatus Acidoferrales bacterium]|nr:ribosome maturation factor RimM [Candidatus Acidoferrales bacterium]
MADSPASRVTLARILRARGRRGEVAAQIFTDFPERLPKLTSAELWDGKSLPRRVAIRECWLSKSHGGQAIFLFDGCNSISDAERLVGLEIQIPLSERVPLATGSYFVTDLIGCEVFKDIGTGAAEKLRFEKLGDVRDVQSTGESVAGTPVLVVATPHGELLIPLATEICTRIDTATRRIEVVLPEGLLDLNQT